MIGLCFSRRSGETGAVPAAEMDGQACRCVGGEPGPRPAPECLSFLPFLLCVRLGGGLFIALNDIIALLEHLMTFEEKAPALRTLTGKNLQVREHQFCKLTLEWFTKRKVIICAHREQTKQSLMCTVRQHKDERGL